MILQELKLKIWTHKRIQRNPIDLQLAADRAGVRLPITQIAEAEKLLKSLARKVKLKVETPAWCIERYQDAHQEWFKREYPAAFKDNHYLPPDFPDVGTSNGLTNFVQNYIKWAGGYSNRLNVAGRKIGDKYIQSTTRKGTEDIDALWQGRKIAIEIKNAHTKDKIRPDQVKQMNRIKSAGGIYIIVTGPENFLEQWDKVVSSIPKQARLL